MAELIFKSISNNPTFEGLASVIPDIVYSHAGGKEIKLTLIVPQTPQNPKFRQISPVSSLYRAADGPSRTLHTNCRR